MWTSTDNGALLFTTADGAEWRIVDARRLDVQVTILSPGSPDAECRIFKPAVGPPLVYVFTHGEPRSPRADVLEAQLAQAMRLNGRGDHMGEEINPPL
jgi:hypothetical protein